MLHVSFWGHSFDYLPSLLMSNLWSIWKRQIRVHSCILCLCEDVDGETGLKGKVSAGSATERQKQYNSLIVPSERLTAATHKGPNLLCVSGLDSCATSFVLALHGSQQTRAISSKQKHEIGLYQEQKQGDKKDE